MTIILTLVCFLVLGQLGPEFEVASIRLSADQALQQINVGLRMDGSQARFTYLSLKDYIGMAYRLKAHQILGPDWLGSQRFDIAAKLPEGSSQDHIPEMLQTLLADRFQMKSHRDRRELPVYALEAAKSGFKIKESEPGPDSQDKAPGVSAVGSPAGGGINLGNGSFFTFGDNRFEGKKLSMAMLADMLTRFLDRPVVDATGLKGNYDLILEIPPEDYRAMLVRSAVNSGIVLPPVALRLLETATDSSLSGALQKAGLALESRKAPLDVLVVDSMQKLPTEN